jgi:serine protease AprX
MGNPVSDLFTQASGTSMACPHASGAVVLIIQARPGLSPAQVKELLMSAAMDLGYPPNVQGAGRADLDAAIRGERTTRPPQPPQPGPTPTPPSGMGCLPPVFWKMAARHE